MKTLKEFQIWLPTEFGTEMMIIRAKDFTDAFFRLGKKDKMKDGWIEDEYGGSKTFCEILGIEETI